MTLARNRVNDRDRDVSTKETSRIFSSLIGLPALAEKDMRYSNDLFDNTLVVMIETE